MCTLSVIPLLEGSGGRPNGGGRDPLVRSSGFRVAMNRDELLTRPVAGPPGEHEVSGGVRAAWPRDEPSGGSWIAANEFGAVAAILNVNDSSSDDDGTAPRSRGLLLPPLMAHSSAVEMVEAVREEELSDYRPFRIVCVDGEVIAEGRWDGRTYDLSGRPLQAFCRVSSGLGDRYVEPRLDLWSRMLSQRGTDREVQNEFHAHRWSDRPHVSVLMDRPDARTVSTTYATVLPDRVEMRYRDDDGMTMPLVLERAPETSDALAGGWTGPGPDRILGRIGAAG